MLRAILFDFNGVLVDDEAIHQAMFARVLLEEGIPFEPEGYFERHLGLDDRRCFAAALEECGRPVQQHHLMRLIARKASYYQERIKSDGFSFFSGAIELVREAAAAGLTLGVVTPTAPSRYIIKQQPHAGCLSTLEATHELLVALDRAGLDHYERPDQLLGLFQRMQEFQLQCAADPSRGGYRRRAYKPPVERVAFQGESARRRARMFQRPEPPGVSTNS